MTVTQKPLPTRSSSSSSSPIVVNLRSRTAMADQGKSTKHSPRIRGASQSSDFEGFLSPGFKSVAAMAGWDEEALLASLVVEDTPEREKKEKKRPVLQFKTPTTNSRRKRRAQRRSPVVVPATVLVLDEEDAPVNGVSSIRPTILDLEGEDAVDDGDLKKKEEAVKDNAVSKKKDKKGEVEVVESSSASIGSSSSLPNLDKLREELSCAICLEICYEPSTTPCGHSFCKKCLRSAADKCGKRCPKCRQLISNGRSCTVNTVLWNTIQLLFPTEVEARKAAATPPRSARIPTQPDQNAPNNNDSNNNVRVRRVSRPLRPPTSTRSNISVPSQDEDAALALRLQREEFLEAYRPSSSSSNGERRSSVTDARATLRAMASRAVSLRTRTRPTYY